MIRDRRPLAFPAVLMAAACLAAPHAAAQQVPPAALGGQIAASVEAVSPTIANQYVVQMDTALESAVLPQLESLGGRVVSRSRRSSVAVIRQPGFESMGPQAALERLSRIPGVRRVEPNFEIERMRVPNDPRAGELWMIEAIELAEAWNVLDDAEPVVVAVIDDGVQIDHEDLAGNIWVNEGEIPGNGQDDDGNGFVDDVNGYDFGEDDGDPRPDRACWTDNDDSAHGTHVAGTVGAVGDNGVGVVGAAPRVQIMALKLSEIYEDRPGCRYAANGSLTAAIEYATLMGADIISMSLGGPRRSLVQRDLLQAAVNQGIVVVAAAGNDGLDIDGDQPHMALIARMRNGEAEIVHRAVAPMYPAAWNLDGQITVAATERSADEPRFVAGWRDDIAWTHMAVGLVYTEDGGWDASGAEIVALEPGTRLLGSNFGPAKVHVAAPGKEILSTVPRPSGQGLASGYASFQGTSMATPAVSGAIAILRAAFPEMTPQQIKARLVGTVDRGTTLRGRVVSGGEINLYAALCAQGAPRALPGCDGAAGAGAEPLPPAGSGTAIAPRAPATTTAPAPKTPVSAAPAEPEETAPTGPVNVLDILGE